jgi:hypothetical protein
MFFILPTKLVLRRTLYKNVLLGAPHKNFKIKILLS